MSDLTDALTARDAVWLIEIDVYAGDRQGRPRLGPMLLGGLGWHPIAALPFGAKTFATKTLGYSDAGWIGEPDDPDKPNALYSGRITAPPHFARQLAVLPEREARASVQYGVVDIANADGALSDVIANNPVIGRRVRLLRGPRSSPARTRYSRFVPLLDGIAAGWREDGLVARLEMRDALTALDMPLQQRRYAGTGGQEGPPDFKNRPRPLPFGGCLNVTPDLIDAALQIHAVSGGAVRGIPAVRDRGRPLPFDKDYPTYDALAKADIPKGHYATCLAAGVLRINQANKDTAITCDVLGSTEGGYADTHAEIVRRIIGRSSLLQRQVDDGGLPLLPGGEAGFFFPSSATPTIAEALNTVLASCAGWWGARRDGRVSAGRLRQTETLKSVLDLDPLVQGEPVELASVQPRWRQTVGYARLWTVNARENLAWEIPDADKQYYTQEFRIAAATSAATALRYPNAHEPAMLVSGFRSAADAQMLADTLLALHGVSRRQWSVPLGPEAYRLDLGDCVRWSSPRAAARNWIVTSMEETGDDVTLTLWG